MSVSVTDSRSLSHSELFVLSRGLAMLDSRFRLQRISHKAMLTMCTPDLKAPDLHWAIRIFGTFIKWFADCSHCNQARPFPTKKTCLVSMIWSHLQQTLRVDQTCYWCCRLWCRLLSTTASCSSWQLHVN